MVDFGTVKERNWRLEGFSFELFYHFLFVLFQRVMTVLLADKKFLVSFHTLFLIPFILELVSPSRNKQVLFLILWLLNLIHVSNLCLLLLELLNIDIDGKGVFHSLDSHQF